MATSTSTLTSGLKQQQRQPSTRLPQPDMMQRRRPSIIDNKSERIIRSRTMSDAPRPDLQRKDNKRVNLRKSLFMDSPEEQKV
ncbi:hypothetical protein G6F68_021419 [Rhizopus microsporus]|nr:hypothetical protein G6F68_021419 [Rhizopus microsporus]